MVKLGRVHGNLMTNLAPGNAKLKERALGILIQLTDLDPHTAVGLRAARDLLPDGPVITLATAHPAKFPDAVEAACGIRPALPAPLADLYEREERLDILPNDLTTLQDHIRGLRRT